MVLTPQKERAPGTNGLAPGHSLCLSFQTHETGSRPGLVGISGRREEAARVSADSWGSPGVACHSPAPQCRNGDPSLALGEQAWLSCSVEVCPMSYLRPSLHTHCALPRPCQNQTRLARRQQAVQPSLCEVRIPAAGTQTSRQTAPRPPVHLRWSVWSSWDCASSGHRSTQSVEAVCDYHLFIHYRLSPQAHSVPGKLPLIYVNAPAQMSPPPGSPHGPSGQVPVPSLSFCHRFFPEHAAVGKGSFSK